MANVARDLFLLSAIAFKNGKFDQSASLFATSLSSDDAAEFLSQIEAMDDQPIAAEASTEVKSTMSDIVRSIRDQIELTNAALAADESDEDPDAVDEQDQDDDSGVNEDVEDDPEAASDNVDPNNPGEYIVPASLSSVNSMVKVKGSDQAGE